jgi:hypothetical protein
MYSYIILIFLQKSTQVAFGAAAFALSKLNRNMHFCAHDSAYFKGELGFGTGEYIASEHRTDHCITRLTLRQIEDLHAIAALVDHKKVTVLGVDRDRGGSTE